MFETSSSPVRAVIVTQAGDAVPAVGDERLRAVDHPLPIRELGRACSLPRHPSRRRGPVRPNAATAVPTRRSGSHSRFCLLGPDRRIGIVPSDVCAATVIATDESTRRELLDGDRVRQRSAPARRTPRRS